MSLYGNLSRDNTVVATRGVNEAFYNHPAYLNMNKAQRKLEMIQSMMDEVLAAVPETPTKGVSVMQLHTASMWLDKAMAEGHKALQAAFIKMEEDKMEEDKKRARHAEYEQAERMGDEVLAGQPGAARRATKRA